MADGGNSYRFSKETRDLLEEHRKYFESLGNVITEMGLGLRGADDDARSEREFTDQGEVKVTFFFPLDDNAQTGDGRLYVKDQFLFDPAQNKLKHFERSFEYNGKGNPALWKPKLERFEGGTYFDGSLDSDKQLIRDYALQVVRSYSRPLTPKIVDVLRQQEAYLTGIKDNAQSVNPAWSLRVGSPETHYKLINRKDSLELVVSWVLDSDKDPANGRVFANDLFVLDPQTLKLKEVRRYWTVGRDSRKLPEMKEFLAKLNEVKGPPVDQTETFISAVLPGLLDPGPLDPSKADPSAPAWTFPPSPGPAWPENSGSPWSPWIAQRKGTLGEKEWQALQRENLGVIRAVALERIQQKDDRSRGLITRMFNSKVDLAAQTALVDSLLEQAATAARPGKDAWKALRDLKLEGDLGTLRDALMADPLIRRAAQAATEPDVELRAAGLMVFAKQDLFHGHRLGGSARLIADLLKAHPTTQKRAEDLLAFLNGGGNIGIKTEMLAPIFLEEATNPKMLAAMALAGPFGATVERGGLVMLGRYGRFWEGASALAGIGGEALAFTSTHHFLDSLSHDPPKAFAHLPSEVASAAMLFGALRLTHWAGAEASLKMAQGKWGKILGGPSSQAIEAVLHQGVSGRVRFPLHVAELGTPLPKLSRGGTALGGLMNHAGGVGAMYAAGFLGRKFELHPAMDQAFGGHLFDAVLSYTQAMVGFRIGNHFTNGAMGRSLAETRLELEAYRIRMREEAAGKRRDSQSVAIPTRELQPGEAIFSLRLADKVLTVEARENIRRIRIGRGGKEAGEVFYPAEDSARVDLPADDATVALEHAELMEKSGIWSIADLGSDYGTMVNGKLAQAGGKPIQVKPGDLIQIGDHLQFTLDVQGDIVTIDREPQFTVPLVAQDQQIPPDHPVVDFPMKARFPNHTVPAGETVVVATLTDAEGNAIEYLSDASSWTLPKTEGGTFVAELYVDDQGRHFFSRDYEGESSPIKTELSVNGRPVAKWSFVRDGNQLKIGNLEFTIGIPEAPLPPSPAKPAGVSTGEDSGLKDMAASLDEGEVDPEFDEGRPTQPVELAQALVQAQASRAHPETEGDVIALEFDDAKTKPLPPPKPPTPSAAPGGKRPRKPPAPPVKITPSILTTEQTRPGGYPIIPEIARHYPPEYLADLDEGEAPMVLLFGGISFTADRTHTSFVLGSAPEVSPDRPWQRPVVLDNWKHVFGNHARVEITTEGEWKLFDLVTEKGTFVDQGGGNFRQLGPNEYVSLSEDQKFSLGPPGDPDSLEVIFTRQGGFRNRMPTLGHRNDVIQTSEFPRVLLSHLGPDHAAATFKIGNRLLKADQKKTSYTFGSEARTPSEDSGVFSIPGDLISKEQARVFISANGFWWIEALESESPTYVNGEVLEPGMPERLSARDRIGLGHPEGQGGGALIIFDQPDYLTWEQAMQVVKDPNDSDSGLIPLGDEDVIESISGLHDLRPSIQPTMRPEPGLARTVPAVRPPKAQPPPPPRRAQTEKPMPPPLPPPDPAPAGEMDFGELNAEVGLDVPGTPAAPATGTPPPPPEKEGEDVVLELADQVRILGTPNLEGPSRAKTPTPALEFGPTSMDNTGVFDLLSGLNPEVFGQLNPDLRSSALLGQLHPFLVETREQLSERVKGLNHYPKMDGSPLRIKSSSNNFLGFFDAIDSAAAQRNGVTGFSEDEMQEIIRLAETYWLGGVLKKEIIMESDRTNLRFSSFPENGAPADTMIAIHLRPGNEIRHLEPVFKHLMTLALPVDVILPRRVQGQDGAFIGVFFRAENFRGIYDAVNAFFEEKPDILGENYLPFSHSLLNHYDKPLPGIGIMQHFMVDSNDPLIVRKRLIIKAYTEYKHELVKGGGTFNSKHLLAKILRAFQENGLDLNNYGFQQGKIEDSHEEIGKHSAPRAPDPEFLELLTRPL